MTRAQLGNSLFSSLNPLFPSRIEELHFPFLYPAMWHQAHARLGMDGIQHLWDVMGLDRMQLMMGSHFMRDLLEMAS